MTPSLTSTPVHRLPKHILQNIFSSIRNDSRPDFSTSSSTTSTYLNITLSHPDPPWYHFTHVCRSWHTEAKSIPSLWNHIRVGYHTTGQIQAYLERSKELPLDVEVSVDDSENNAVEVRRQIEYLTHHGKRIRYLLVKLSCCPESSLDIFIPLFARLRDITSLQILSFPTRAITSTLQVPNPNPPNPLHHLRTLQLHCVLPTAQLHIKFTNVSHLSMAWSNHAPYPTWHEFSSLITACSNLTSLEIDDYEWDDVQFPLAAEDIITSPTLRTLSLTSTKPACTHLLYGLNLSTVLQISIICKAYHISDSDSILLPYHLSNTTPCTNLSISSTPQSITFSATLTVPGLDAEQNLKITLLLQNTKGTLKRTWIDRIIDSWIKSAPFDTAPNVLRSGGHITNVSSDDDIVPISLPRAITSEEKS